MAIHGQQNKESIMSTTTDTTTRTRIVTLTDRAPVKIVEADWPVIAKASGDSYGGRDPGRFRQAAMQGEIDMYTLVVRRHADGRTLVYGVVDAAIAAWGQPAAGEDWRGGELVPAGGDLALVIKRIAEGHIPDSVIRECIADLPAEEI